MNNEKPNIHIWQKIELVRRSAIVAVCVVFVCTPIVARQMECSYDYITHTTTLQLDDLGQPSGTISYRYAHSVSPVGGEEMYFFRDRNPAELKGFGQFEFIMKNLFHDPHATISALQFIDFDRPALKQFQAPAAYLERSNKDIISVPIVIWDCHRVD